MRQFSSFVADADNHGCMMLRAPWYQYVEDKSSKPEVALLMAVLKIRNSHLAALLEDLPNKKTMR